MMITKEKESFINLYKSKSQAIALFRAYLRSHKESLHRYKSAHEQYTQLYAKSQEELTNFKKTTKIEAKEIVKTLLAIPKVERLQMGENCIIVHTECITIGGVKIGKFKITLATDRSCTFENKTRVVNRCHHPYITADKHVRGLSGSMQSNMFRNEFKLAITACMNALTTYDEDDGRTMCTTLEQWQKGRRRPRIRIERTKPFSMDKFIELIDNNRLRTLNRIIESHQIYMQDYKNAYDNTKKSITQTQEKLARYESYAFSQEQAELELENLSKHPDIKDFHLDQNELIVNTVPIFITHRNKTYDIGLFKIILRMNGTVTIYNMTRTVNGVHHPHVGRDGYACFGNISHMIPDLIYDLKFGVAINLCLNFLKSYTRSDDAGPYIYIDQWEEATKNGTKTGNLMCERR